jgi:hypothetical protein
MVKRIYVSTSVGEPDPEPDSAGSACCWAYQIRSGLKYCLQNKILTQNFSKKFNFWTEDYVPVGKLKGKNMKKNFIFASLKPMKKGSDPEPD